MSARARDKRASQRGLAGPTSERRGLAGPAGEASSSAEAGVHGNPDGWRGRGWAWLVVLARPLGGDPVLRWIAVWCLLSAAALHAAVAAPHYAEWAVEGWFFVALELAQVGVALALATRPSRLACAAGVVVNAGAVALWALSRTVGTPLGPAAGEVGAIGTVDLVTAMLELVAIGALAILITSRVPAPRRRPSVVRGQVALGGVAVAALVLYAVGGGIGHVEDFEDDTAAASASEEPADGAASAASKPVEGPVGVPLGWAPTGEASLDLAATNTDNEANRFDGDRFDTDTLRVPAGVTTVLRFANAGSQQHNVAVFPVGDPAQRVFTGKTVDPGASIAYPFVAPEPGAYRFQCDLHPWMQGTFTAT